MEETIMFVYVAIGILTGIYFIFSEIKKETDDFTKSIYPAGAAECLTIGAVFGLFWPIVIITNILRDILRYFVNIVVKNKRKNTIKSFKDYTKEMGRIALYNNLEEILNGDTNIIRICEEIPKDIQAGASIASFHRDTYTLEDNNVEVTLEYIVRSTYIEAIVTVTNN